MLLNQSLSARLPNSNPIHEDNNLVRQTVISCKSVINLIYKSNVQPKLQSQKPLRTRISGGPKIDSMEQRIIRLSVSLPGIHTLYKYLLVGQLGIQGGLKVVNFIRCYLGHRQAWQTALGRPVQVERTILSVSHLAGQR